MNKFPKIKVNKYNIHSNSRDSLKIKFYNLRKLKFKFLHYRSKFISLDYKSECMKDEIWYYWTRGNINGIKSLIYDFETKEDKLSNTGLFSLDTRISKNKLLSLENGSLEILNE